MCQTFVFLFPCSKNLKTRQLLELERLIWELLGLSWTWMDQEEQVVSLTQLKKKKSSANWQQALIV